MVFEPRFRQTYCSQCEFTFALKDQPTSQTESWLSWRSLSRPAVHTLTEQKPLNE